MRSCVNILLLIFFVNVLPAWAEPEEINKKGCRDCHRFSLKEKQLNKGPDLFYSGDKFHKNSILSLDPHPLPFSEINNSASISNNSENCSEIILDSIKF